MTDLEIIKKYRNPRDLKCHYPDLYTKIINNCSDKLKDYKFCVKSVWYLNNLTDFPECPICHKKITRKDIKEDGYVGAKSCCSYSCYHQTEEYKNKYATSIQNKYGCSCSDFLYNNGKKVSEISKQKKDLIKSKIISTYLQKSDLEKKLIVEKYRKTCLKKYGVDNTLKVKYIKDKANKTLFEKYGEDYYQNYFRVKSKETMLKKYGCEFPWQNKDILEKCTRNMMISVLKKYGVKCTLNLEDIKNKTIQTNIERYGVDNYSKSRLFKDRIREVRFDNIENQNCRQNCIPLFTKQDYCKNGIYYNYKWKCPKCNNIFESPWYVNQYHYTPLCPHCYSEYNTASVTEIELRDYIKSIYKDEIIYNTRKIIYPLELDMYIPKKNIAIEYNGLWWHCEYKNSDKNYHLYKQLKCKENNVQLIHIFEDEWIYKKDIVKSRIKNILGICDVKLYARKCQVKKIEFENCKDFLNNNHIQGSCNSSINYGLYYNNELVSVMTFGSYRKNLGKDNINNEYELLRFCNKLNYCIVGAASRLFKNFIRDYNPNQVISYCDKRWSNGNLYLKLGMSLDHETEPNYYYIVNNKRENRFKYRKSELSKYLKNFNSNLSEHQNMLNNKIYRIYDCGNFVYKLNK